MADQSKTGLQFAAGVATAIAVVLWLLATGLAVVAVTFDPDAMNDAIGAAVWAVCASAVVVVLRSAGRRP